MFINRNGGRPKPTNRGAVVGARSAINTLARAAQERYVNALSVQGYPCEYYSYKRLGITCTCSSTLTDVPEVGPGLTVLDAEGNATPNHIQAMLQGSTVSITRYGARSTGQGFPDDYVEERAVPNRPLNQSASQYNKTTDCDAEFGEELEPTDDLDALLDVDNQRPGDTFLQQQGFSGCGVCLGTTYVGGYNFVNGSRVVYDTQHPWAVQGFTKSTVERPHTWKQIAGEAWAQLFVMLPLGAQSLRALRLWNSKTLLTGYRLEVHDGSQWVPVTAGVLMPLCTGQLRAMRVISLVIDLKFTHLEVSFNLNLNPIYVEWSKLTESENQRLPENTEPLGVIISPTVPRVRMYDILIDSTYNRVWKVSSVTNFKDRQLRVHGWEAQIRLVQQFEYPQLLANAVLLHRHPESTNALVPPVEAEDWSGHQDTPTR